MIAAPQPNRGSWVIRICISIACGAERGPNLLPHRSIHKLREVANLFFAYPQRSAGLPGIRRARSPARNPMADAAWSSKLRRAGACWALTTRSCPGGPRGQPNSTTSCDTCATTPMCESRTSGRSPSMCGRSDLSPAASPSRDQTGWTRCRFITASTRPGATVLSALAVTAMRGAICTGRVRAAVSIQSAASAADNPGSPS